MNCPHCKGDNPKKIKTKSYGKSLWCKEGCGIVWPENGDLKVSTKCLDKHKTPEMCEVVTLDGIQVNHCCVCGIIFSPDEEYNIYKKIEEETEACDHLHGHLDGTRIQTITEGLRIDSMVDVVTLDAIFTLDKVRYPVKILARLKQHGAFPKDLREKIEAEISEKMGAEGKIFGGAFEIDALAILNSTIVEDDDGNPHPIMQQLTEIVRSDNNTEQLKNYLEAILDAQEGVSDNSDFV
ncbi:hypothetical protein LCGC14_0195150 [marine sediment metagenome]|uniref:Uncharacterized protein n=1 Tax=marine sediment metagenome TaxID=412755 RepID=A0A0F9V1T5_9ZZZZ